MQKLISYRLYFVVNFLVFNERVIEMYIDIFLVCIFKFIVAEDQII